jgi:hypothetical protein
MLIVCVKKRGELKMGEFRNENWTDWANAWNKARAHYNQIRRNIEKRKIEFSEKIKKQTTLGG